VPAAIGDYTDFYASIFHATRVGRLFRPDSPLLPNYKFVPIGYHGRASSIVVSGAPIVRPRGQTRPDPAAPPVFGPSARLDYELEVGLLVGAGNALGEPVPVERAEEHAFGLCLVNDWSARDVQQWEYQPLGPFLAKNFMTTISPWVVSMEALEPFRCPGPQQSPEPLPYLHSPEPGSYDIQLEVYLATEQTREPVRICRTNYQSMYWNISQQLAHHTVNGCSMRTGDLCGSGTISGPTPDSRGSLLEITWNTAQPLSLPSGEMRGFLQDGDTVILTGWAQGDGYRVGFGEVRGTLLPALPLT
jgi:fumarylacetoacetase